MKEKIFMILGGSKGQIPAILAAKKIGFKTLVIDKDPEAIGAQLADYFECVNTTDKEVSLDIARKYDICGAMTISSDIAVPTVCFINEQLSLPNQGAGIGQNVTDKALMRRLFKEHNVQSPIYFVYEGSDTLGKLIDEIKVYLVDGPFIVKPTDSSGSRGVTKIYTIDELVPAIEKSLEFSRNKKIIIEQFIEGIEIGAQGFSINGKMEKCFIHNDVVSTNMIPVGHSFNYIGSEESIEVIKSECQKALSALGIINGPSNIDLIITPEGMPYVIEIGARIGATKLPEIVEYYSGWSIIESTINQSAGEPFTIEETKRTPVAVEMLYFEQPGIIEVIKEYDDIVRKYNPIEYSIELTEQMNIRPLKSGVDVYGYVICEGTSVVEAEDNCRAFIHELKDRIIFKRAD